MIFNLSTMHLGDVLMALPAMRAGDQVIAREQHRVPGAPVEWLDSGVSPLQPELCRFHQTNTWLRAADRTPMRHELLPPPADRYGVVLAPAVRGKARHWPHWLELQRRLGPEALVVDGDVPRAAWMAALNGARVVVCPDTGTAHMADALGVPKVVVLHGLGWAHYWRYHPYWNATHCIVRDRIDEITVDDVIGEVRV